MKKIAITLAETAQWHAMLGRAEYLEQQCLPADVADYLVRLFLRVELDTMTQQSLMLANENHDADADGKLQRLGDKCLLLCGFYPEVADDFAVALEEFVSMGREAYRSLANNGNAEDGAMFSYLANNFETITDMLSRIQQLSCSSIVAQSGVDTQPSHPMAGQVSHKTSLARAPLSRSLN